MEIILIACVGHTPYDLFASICIFSLFSTLLIHMNVNAQNTFNVVDFGALGNGISDDSLAFIKAWNAACNAKAPTSTMIVPSKKTYLVHPTTFSGPCSSIITIQLSGKIQAPDDPSAWKESDIWRWLLFENVTTGLNIQGPGGVIDGRGEKWWDISCRDHPGQDCRKFAPRALMLKNCNNVNVSNIYVARSPQVHIVVVDSHDIHFRKLVISAFATSPNTDGIHISNSHHVTVQGTVIRSGDDCVSIGDQTSNVEITYSYCGPGHGVSIGSLGKDGNEVQVENITVRHVKFQESTNGARIKTWQAGRGYVRNIEFSDLNFTQVENPIIIDQYYCDHAQESSCQKSSTGVHISDVRYLNAYGTSATDVAINLNCSQNVACTNIILENIQLGSAIGGKPVVSSCNNAFGLAKGTVKPTSCLRS